MSVSSRSSSWDQAVQKEEVEELLGLEIGDLALYRQALTHRSYWRGRGRLQTTHPTNERLEFLGDALLGFVAAEHLYTEYADESEGYLTRLRAKLVNGRALAEYARHLDLGSHILMSKNMAQSQGRENPTILADAFEALLGALYLDQGLATARAFIYRVVFSRLDIDHLARRDENYKSLLMEYMQARSGSQPTYRIVEAQGPSHDRTFTAEVLIDDTPYGRGTAGSKKSAEQEAAGRALTQLRQEEAAE